MSRRSMHKALEHCYHELAGVRTGRVSPTLLDGVMVNVHGDKVSLAHLATVVMKGTRTLGVTVYDRDSTPQVLAAIRDSPLQLQPREEGGQVIVPIPESASLRSTYTASFAVAVNRLLAHRVFSGQHNVVRAWESIVRFKNRLCCSKQVCSMVVWAHSLGSYRMSPDTRKAMVKLAHQHAEHARVVVRQVRHKAMADLKAMGKQISEDERKIQEKEVDELTKKCVKDVDNALQNKEKELDL
jgi:ribosome recycling factor